MSASVTTYYLEIRDRANFRPILHSPPGARLARVETPSPELNRFFYATVGAPWRWIDRLVWSLDDWREYLQSNVETWVLTVGGVPAGYVEIDCRSGDPELAYCGLLPEFIGRGLGGYLMTAAIERAFEIGSRVWVHTCTLDHPSALAAYQARGFQVYREEVRASSPVPEGAPPSTMDSAGETCMEPRVTDARKEYERGELDEITVNRDPIRQFSAWYDEAVAAGILEPEAMTLATATPDGHPSARIVLLRGFDARGFCFFTNYDSHKGRELAANPHAALVFHWTALERQVRIEGRVEKTTEAESDAYFKSRPPKSRIGAWSSPQSDVLPNRAALEDLFAKFQADNPDDTVIPRPPHWGGYRLIPERIEFWQGRRSRLHDRIRFRRDTDGAWIIERLAP
jgi:pyridoxamine 5'-phosphate oxidase